MRERLVDIDEDTLGALFQVSDDNPLVGLDGRAALLRRLRRRRSSGRRPGALFDTLTAQTRTVGATGDPARVARHAGADLAHRQHARRRCARRRVAPSARGRRRRDAQAGCRSTSCRSGSRIRCSSRSNGPASTVTGRDALTALPEYRNGGLLLDTGVLAWRDAGARRRVAWDVGSELVVEWRALTVALDRRARAARARARSASPTCRSPASSKAAPGPRAASSRARSAAAFRRFAVSSDGTVF